MLPAYSCKTYPSQSSVMGAVAEPHRPRATGHLLFPLGPPDGLAHTFIVMPTCLTWLLGRDIMAKLRFPFSFHPSPSGTFLLFLASEEKPPAV